MVIHKTLFFLSLSTSICLSLHCSNSSTQPLTHYLPQQASIYLSLHLCQLLQSSTLNSLNHSSFYLLHLTTLSLSFSLIYLFTFTHLTLHSFYVTEPLSSIMCADPLISNKQCLCTYSENCFTLLAMSKSYIACIFHPFLPVHLYLPFPSLPSLHHLTCPYILRSTSEGSVALGGWEAGSAQ